ncbi:MAG TPA: glycogen/starch synthase, partial [Spirochaetota bacterium]
MKKLTIVFTASESLPFVKTGGLADVSFALTRELAAEGHDVYLFLPRYYKIDKTKWDCVPVEGALGVPIGFGERWAALYLSDAIPGVKTYFIEHDAYYGRDGLYDNGYDAFGDNAERFVFYCRAVMQACLKLDIHPDIMHCNDWQTGMIPIYVKSLYRHLPHFMNTKSVMTIHNIGYQGVFNKNEIVHTQLGWEAYNEDCLKFFDSINFLKGGLLWADAITTVSRKYAEEIKTPEFGYDLAGILSRRSEQLFGITNGVDYGSWDPAHDAAIPVNYTPSKMRGKLLCKEHLQNEFHLRVNSD